MQFLLDDNPYNRLLSSNWVQIMLCFFVKIIQRLRYLLSIVSYIDANKKKPWNVFNAKDEVWSDYFGWSIN